MIIPVYFPYTYMPAAVSCALLSCFEKITIFQPSRHLIPASSLLPEAENRLDIRFPDIPETDPLLELLREYHSWADLHRGERPDIHRFGSFPAPVSDDSSTAWIRSKIRRMETGEESPAPSSQAGASLLLKARLFLAIAHEYDQQKELLSRDLHRIEDLEKALFQNLSPDRETTPLPLHAGRSPDGAADMCRPMPEERLSAWSRLYMHQNQDQSANNISDPLPQVLFITSDREVLSLLLPRATGSENVCTVINIPCSGRQPQPSGNPSVSEKIEAELQKAVRDLPYTSAVEIPYLDGGHCHEETARLDIYRISGNPLPDFIQRADNLSGSTDSSSGLGGAKYSFFACISPL